MFHDVNLPNFIAIHAKGGPIFDTSIVATNSGREIRISNRYKALHQYVITDCYLNQLQFEEFNSFFRARLGMTFGFRLKDYSDYSCVAQLIGIGNGTNRTFQLIKVYKDFVSPYTRVITKPLDLKLYINDIESQNYQFDNSTGVIYVSEAPKNGERVVADFTFDVPVRFNNRQFKYSFQNDGNILINDLLLIEV